VGGWWVVGGGGCGRAGGLGAWRVQPVRLGPLLHAPSSAAPPAPCALPRPQVVNAAYARAVRNCPWVGSLWARALQALERSGGGDPEHKQLYERALQAGLQVSAACLPACLPGCLAAWLLTVARLGRG
jgi:hypothetical protein